LGLLRHVKYKFTPTICPVQVRSEGNGIISSMSSPFEVKVCVIGDTDVGKTSLSTRYCHGEFPEISTPTIGASFLQRRVTFDNVEISLQIWDTAGQER
jgi:GTPase SAR1 family protein